MLSFLIVPFIEITLNYLLSLINEPLDCLQFFTISIINLYPFGVLLTVSLGTFLTVRMKIRHVFEVFGFIATHLK